MHNMHVVDLAPRSEMELKFILSSGLWEGSDLTKTQSAVATTKKSLRLLVASPMPAKTKPFALKDL